MNNPFILEQTASIAECAGAKSAGDERQRIELLYKLVFQRAATDNELRRAERFLKLQQPTNKVSPLAKLAQVLLLSNELMFVD